VIAAVLAEVEGLPNVSLDDVFLAMAVGYETSCRLGVAVGKGQWERGSHNTGTVAMYGCIAALASLRKYDLTTTENAFGIGTSFLCSSLQFLVNGAWNKRLHPGTAAHNAFVVTAFAQAGVVGAVEPIEGRHGLLNNCSGAPVAKGLCDGLGSEWRFLGIALKPYPACRWTHGEIEMAGLLATKAKGKPVKQIHIVMDNACYLVVGERVANKVHPRNVVDAQFSIYYQVAAAWLYGSNQGWSIYDRLDDPKIADLADKISVDTADMPFRLNSSMKVTWEDGSVEEMAIDYPLWEPERPASWKDVCDKFESIVPGTLGVERTKKILQWFEKSERDSLVAPLIELLA
jgi:2-methylcitrate dehydratase PrpD